MRAGLAVPLAALVAAMLAASLGISPAAAAAEWDVYAKVEHLNWEEFADSGARLLEEKGYLYGFGFAGKVFPQSALIVRPKAEILLGSIDYDGQDQFGTPVKTDSDYVVAKAEADVGGHFKVADRVALEPFAGLGYRWWTRDINSTPAALGYTETWQTLYVRLGANVEAEPSPGWKVFAGGGAKIPVYNKEDVDLFDVTLKPGRKTSAFGEIGLKYRLMKITGTYEGMKFSRSENAAGSGGTLFFQPRSEARIYGVNLGVSF